MAVELPLNKEFVIQHSVASVDKSSISGKTEAFEEQEEWGISRNQMFD